MQPLRSQPFAALLAFACLAFALPDTSRAGKLKFPSDDPAFTVELPSGWTQTRDTKGNLNCDSHDDSGYNFSILLLPGIQSEKQLKAELPNLARNAGLKNFKVGNVEDTENENGVRFAEVKGRGENDGTPLVVVVSGFQPQNGRFYALLSVGTEKTDKKHASDYEGIAASIEPLKATGKKESDAGLPIADTTLGWYSKAGYVSVYFQPGGKCTIDFQGNEARFEGREDQANTRMTKSYEVTSLPGSKWRVRILLDDPQDVTFRTTKVNPAAKNGETVIAAIGINEGDPYQRGQEGELKFVRGKQSRPPE